jgi:glycoside/pentoside/hexuronide:cation symporter, GPH family
MSSPSVPAPETSSASAHQPAAADAPDSLPTNRVPPLRAKASFGLTAAVENTQFQVYEYFLIFYYAQVLGLAGSWAGLAVAISVAVDAFTDPLIGNVSDSLRGRFGRRHTLMFFAIVPIAILIWLLFSPPQGLGQTGLFLWLVVMSLSVRVVSSFYSVPAAAIAAELTEHVAQRSELGIWRQATASAGRTLLFLAIGAWVFVAQPGAPDGRLNADNYPTLGLLVGGFVGLCALIGALGTYGPIRQFERVRLSAVRPQRLSVLAALGKAWGALLELPNFRALFLGLLFAGIMGSYFRALNLHLGTYFWELTPGQTGAWLSSVEVAMFVTAVASRLVVGKIEPKVLYVIGVALMLCAYVTPPALRLAGLLPDNGTDALLAVLFGSNMLVGAGTGLIMSCSLVLFAETADEYAYVKRESRTGMVLAFLPLGNKLASSFGKLLAGFVIQWIAFPVGRPAEEIADAQLETLGFAAFGVTLLAGLVSLWFYLGYRLTRARHSEILRGLESMRAAEAASSAGVRA